MEAKGSSTAEEYRIALVEDPRGIDPLQWDSLLLSQAEPTPFMRHTYLAALHASASAVDDTGWSPRFLTVRSGEQLVGAVALYLKTHSYGEYVFDWAWADAYRRHGLRYYPKLLGASPFTPVPGSRLLARDAAVRRLLVRTITSITRDSGLSSAHVLFIDEADRRAFEAESPSPSPLEPRSGQPSAAAETPSSSGWMIRHGVQFHWQRDPASPCATLDEMLTRMHRHKRKNILQERRKVAEAGVSFSVLQGVQITAADWDFFHHCYTLTYHAHGSAPYLTREFFSAMAQHMPEHWVMFVASRGGRRIAASLVAIDEGQGLAWGRYWGCTEQVPCLHFEACYYQPLAWCIERGYRRFEGGAQGEHKMARGLLPVPTCSAHWLADARFADAVAEFLAREGQGVAAYVDELRERNPFRPGGDSPSSPSPG